jgi:hypothetical protein
MKWAKKKKKETTESTVVTGSGKSKLKTIITNKWFLIVAGLVLISATSFGVYWTVIREDTSTQTEETVDKNGYTPSDYAEQEQAERELQERLKELEENPPAKDEGSIEVLDKVPDSVDSPEPKAATATNEVQ